MEEISGLTCAGGITWPWPGTSAFPYSTFIAPFCSNLYLTRKVPL